MPRRVVVFVHGILSSEATWGPLHDRLNRDPELSEIFNFEFFPYPTPKWSISPRRRIPPYDTIASSLANFLEVTCGHYASLVLVCHSQGGLIAQRFLVQMLNEGRGAELARIDRIILLACPNSGSEFLLQLRKTMIRWHPQERSLRPLDADLSATHRRVLKDVVNTTEGVSKGTCPIEFSVYCGESDNIVLEPSAAGAFPLVRALPGDHNSILDVTAPKNRTFETIRLDLLKSVESTRLLAQDPPEGGIDAHGRPRTSEGDGETSLLRPSPLLRVTRTSRRWGTTQSQMIEIFDRSTADSWIAGNKADE